MFWRDLRIVKVIVIKLGSNGSGCRIWFITRLPVVVHEATSCQSVCPSAEVISTHSVYSALVDDGVLEVSPRSDIAHASMGAASLRTWEISALEPESSCAICRRSVVAFPVVELAACNPGTWTPSDSSTARTVSTKLDWSMWRIYAGFTLSLKGNEKNSIRKARLNNSQSPYPGVCEASMITSLTASIANTEPKSGSRWDKAVITAAHMRARW